MIERLVRIKKIVKGLNEDEFLDWLRGVVYG